MLHMNIYYLVDLALLGNVCWCMSIAISEGRENEVGSTLYIIEKVFRSLRIFD